MNVTCLECDAEIEVDPEVKLWDEITCTACGIVMEVIHLDPLEVDYALDDWDDDEDWEEEEDWEDEEQEGS